MALPSSLLLPLQILLLLAAKTLSEDPPLISCDDPTNYTSGSPYESNLRSLITNLTASTWNSSSSFSTSYIGSSPDAQVFGLAQCRPDASDATCFDCLNSSAITAIKRCLLRKSVATRGDHCVLRYSDKNFFSILDVTGWVISNVVNASNPVRKQRVHDLMNKISPEAANADSRFGVGVANYAELADIYGMAWCTQDLSSSDCLQCLKLSAGSLDTEKVVSHDMRFSCSTIFATSAFFPLSLVPPPPQLQQSQTPPPTAEEAKDAHGKGKSSNTAKTVLIIALPVTFASAFVCVFFILLLRRKRAFERLPTKKKLGLGHLVQQNIRNAESLLFDLDTIRKATNDFSEKNKLGEGGFGPVYKGLLEDGQLIAVKRLSRTSSQGSAELINEVALVAKLQHKNLVRLLGCCLEDNEKMLVYEYLPKTSLDKYLFDSIERTQLDWGSRYRIIEGVCRGLLHLHADSRRRIIHRDLKASNILLDSNMRPKISDFGLARLFHIDQTQQNTNRIAGTYGYMAPEYAMHGLFSTKSDVFSYGVLVLEIITGRRNDVFTDKGRALNLLSYVWKYWNQGTALQVVDQCLGHEYKPQKVLRCVHIGLLCVQDDSLLRPSMDSVMLMISSHSTTFPAPTLPPFYVGSSSYGDSESSARETEQNVSQNES